MKIAAYCRVSTEKEAQIDSLEKQIEFFNEFTKKNGYELYKLYADEGISGKQIKHRKQFQQMMQDAKLKKFDKVVVKDVSRFARNTVDLLQSVRELKSYNVQVDFLNNGEVMEGGSEFILTILGAMAQQESANMSKRVKFGKYEFDMEDKFYIVNGNIYENEKEEISRRIKCFIRTMG